MTGAAPGDRTRLRRLHQRGHYDRDTIDAVLVRIRHEKAPPSSFLCYDSSG